MLRQDRVSTFFIFYDKHVNLEITITNKVNHAKLILNNYLKRTQQIKITLRI